ncbi:hypothetical protein PR048_022366 [Dryococelus australis]|uniref:DDE-1 domain-containing protein n=1 Tax=Dryococelus australis TaxID=614101 RepID=A0ABQ9H0U7_9NEOP|nr:hypothetical protein PR048_022366 [Dryococelus australis]
MKGKRNVMSVTAKEREETLTVLTCVRATGVFLPPFVILKGETMKQELRDNLPPGSVVFMSDSCYITVELFRKFLGHFVTHKRQGKKTNLLVLDGHSTHVSDPDILQFAVDNNIIMISIPPHTLHYIQPLVRSFFRSLKIALLWCWIKQNPARSITKLQSGMLLSQAWGKACSVENGVSEFRACGFVSFNPGAIPESAFSPSECFQITEIETPAERPHCSFHPTNAEPVPGTSGLSDCGVSRQTKRRLSCSSSDSSPEDSFREDLHSKKDINSLLQQLCPTPRILQKKSSSRGAGQRQYRDFIAELHTTRTGGILAWRAVFYYSDLSNDKGNTYITAASRVSLHGAALRTGFQYCHRGVDILSLPVLSSDLSPTELDWMAASATRAPESSGGQLQLLRDDRPYYSTTRLHDSTSGLIASSTHTRSGLKYAGAGSIGVQDGVGGGGPGSRRVRFELPPAGGSTGAAARQPPAAPQVAGVDSWLRSRCADGGGASVRATTTSTGGATVSAAAVRPHHDTSRYRKGTLPPTEHAAAAPGPLEAAQAVIRAARDGDEEGLTALLRKTTGQPQVDLNCVDSSGRLPSDASGRKFTDNKSNLHVRIRSYKTAANKQLKSLCASVTLRIGRTAVVLMRDDKSPACCGVVVTLLAFHLAEPWFNSRRGRVRESGRTMPLASGFSRGISRFPRHFTPHSPRCTLIGSQDIDVKRHPNLFTRSVTHLINYAVNLWRLSWFASSSKKSNLDFRYSSKETTVRYSRSGGLCNRAERKRIVSPTTWSSANGNNRWGRYLRLEREHSCCAMYVSCPGVGRSATRVCVRVCVCGRQESVDGRGRVVDDQGAGWGRHPRSLPTELTRTSDKERKLTDMCTINSYVGGAVAAKAVSLLASHQRKPYSIPGRATPGFLHVVIVPDDATGRRVFSGISRFLRPFIPVLLHTPLSYPHRLSRSRC